MCTTQLNKYKGPCRAASPGPTSSATHVLVYHPAVHERNMPYLRSCPSTDTGSAKLNIGPTDDPCLMFCIDWLCIERVKHRNETHRAARQPGSPEQRYSQKLVPRSISDLYLYESKRSSAPRPARRQTKGRLLTFWAARPDRRPQMTHHASGGLPGRAWQPGQSNVRLSARALLLMSISWEV